MVGANEGEIPGAPGSFFAPRAPADLPPPPISSVEEALAILKHHDKSHKKDKKKHKKVGETRISAGSSRPVCRVPPQPRLQALSTMLF